MASVTVITGTYPTTAPSGLSANVLAAGPYTDDGVNFTVVVASGTDTFYGIGYHRATSRWVPISTLARDSSVCGGVVHGRERNLGVKMCAYTHFAIWRSGGSVTPTVSDIETIHGGV